MVRRRHRPEGRSSTTTSSRSLRIGRWRACGMLGAGHPPLHRFRLGLEFALSGHREVDDDDRPPRRDGAHARRAARAARRRCSTRSAPSYERWDGRGWPGELEGEEVPIAARLAQAGRVRRGRAPGRRRRRRRGSSRASGAASSSTPRSADAGRGGGRGDPRPGSTRVGTWDAVIEAEPALAVVLSGERFDAALLADRELRRPEVAVLPRPRARGRRPRRPRPGRGSALAEPRAADAAARRPGARPRPARRLERDLGQARPARRRRVGARAPAPVPDRAHAPPVGGARAAGRDRRPAPRAARRLGLPARARRAPAISQPARDPRRRRRLPGDARAAAAPRRRARPRRPPPSCAPRCGPAASTPRRSRRCSAPPATACRAGARGRRASPRARSRC